MKQALRFLSKCFAGGAAALVGAFAVALSIHAINAAQLSLYSGVSGTNPIQNPSILADANTLINAINANAAMATTNTAPSTALGITQASLGALQTGAGSTPVPILATMSAVWTTVTSNCASNSVSVSVCMGIVDLTDASGFKLHWLAGK